VAPSAFLEIGGAVLIAIAVWVGGGLVLDDVSGWSRLSRVFPDKSEPPLRSLGFQSGSMGSFQCRGILSLSACSTGLRLSLMRLVAPLSRDIMVPWSEIYAQHVPGLFGAKAQLSFGNDVGSIRINAGSWEALVAMAKGRAAYDERGRA